MRKSEKKCLKGSPKELPKSSKSKQKREKVSSGIPLVPTMAPRWPLDLILEVFGRIFGRFMLFWEDSVEILWIMALGRSANKNFHGGPQA